MRPRVADRDCGGGGRGFLKPPHIRKRMYRRGESVEVEVQVEAEVKSQE